MSSVTLSVSLESQTHTFSLPERVSTTDTNVSLCESFPSLHARAHTHPRARGWAGNTHTDSQDSYCRNPHDETFHDGTFPPPSPAGGVAGNFGVNASPERLLILGARSRRFRKAL